MWPPQNPRLGRAYSVVLYILYCLRRINPGNFKSYLSIAGFTCIPAPTQDLADYFTFGQITALNIQAHQSMFIFSSQCECCKP